MTHRKSKFIFWSSFFASAVLVFCPSLKAETGVLPKSILDSAVSVFRIVPLNLGDSGESSSGDQRRAALSGECVVPRHFITRLRCTYMKNSCPAEGECRIPFTTSGTGFLVGDGKTLVSAFHVLGAAELLSLTFMAPAVRLYTPEHQNQVYSDYRPDFLLFNSAQQLVYDTRDYPQAHKFEMVGDPIRGFAPHIAGEMPSHLAGFAYDFGQVRLQKQLAPGLQSKIPTEKDQIFWALGYPMQTEGRASNYDGFRIYANQGRRFSMKEAGESFGFVESEESRKIPLLISGNDVVEGFSGGPLFSEDGQVIGIISATLSTEQEFRGASFGVQWQNFSSYQLGPYRSASK